MRWADSARNNLCRVGRKSVPFEELESIGELPKIVSGSFPVSFLTGLFCFHFTGARSRAEPHCAQLESFGSCIGKFGESY